MELNVLEGKTEDTLCFSPFSCSHIALRFNHAHAAFNLKNYCQYTRYFHGNV